jgi:hypothetical protein
MTHEIVVSRRDGILTAPDGTKHRVARGKTLADADHPAVLANPRDWVPMVVTLTLGDRPRAGDLDTPLGAQHERVVQLENDVTELEETLAARDAELIRLADQLAARGVELPAEDDREPGWLVDLVFEWMDRFGTAAYGKGRDDEAAADPVAPPAAVLAPPRPRKRALPPLTTRTGDDG